MSLETAPVNPPANSTNDTKTSKTLGQCPDSTTPVVNGKDAGKPAASGQQDTTTANTTPVVNGKDAGKPAASGQQDTTTANTKPVISGTDASKPAAFGQ